MHSFQKRGPNGKIDKNGATKAAMNLSHSTLGQRGTWQRWERRFARLGDVLMRIPAQYLFLF